MRILLFTGKGGVGKTTTLRALLGLVDQVAELRDGWYRWNRAIFPDYPAWRDGLERRLEQAVIRAASRVPIWP